MDSRSVDYRFRDLCWQGAAYGVISGIVLSMGSTVLGYHIDLNPFDGPSVETYIGGTVLTILGVSAILAAIATRK